MGLNFLSKNKLVVKGNSYVGYLFQFIQNRKPGPVGQVRADRLAIDLIYSGSKGNGAQMGDRGKKNKGKREEPE